MNLATMNLMKVYIEKVIGVIPWICSAEWAKGKRFVKVDLAIADAGKERRVSYIWEENHWNRVRANGFYLV